MTLRVRLALAFVLVAVPLVAVLVRVREDMARRAIDQATREFVITRMEMGGRQLCEESPETFPDRMRGMGRLDPSRRGPGPRMGVNGRPRGRGGPGRMGGGPDRRPRIEMFAYSLDFTSANPRAPEFPARLMEALEGGRDFASTAYEAGEVRGRQVAVRIDRDGGPCAVILARHVTPHAPGVPPGLIGSAAALCGALLIAVLLAAGPVVGRIRRLTAAVRRSAAERYRSGVDVEGADEVAQLARAFNEASSQIKTHLEGIERREEALRTFVGNTTHDVMIPLTVLQGHLTAMRKQIEAGVAVEKDLILSASEEVHYLTSLVRNLGAAAKLEAGEFQIQRHPVEMNDLVERAVARHRPIARQKEIDLDFAVPESTVRVEGDVTLIEQALSNVIHNAVRYNRPGGHVAVILEEADGAESRFSLKVIDDGPGVSADQIARLSERAFRGDEARSRHSSGHGLGLHIARDVADRHGFTLEIRPSEAGGLEVEFRGSRVASV
jgi:signal transduction histidine kinase